MKWQTKKIGDILKLEYGKPLNVGSREENGKYPVYGANGIKTFSSKYFCDQKSIIVGRKGSAGELMLTDGKFWPLDVTYFVVFDVKKYDVKFLYYLLKAVDLPKLAKGVKPGINRNDVYAINAKIPYSLLEQQKIVRILDEVFESIEKAKKNISSDVQRTKDLFQFYLDETFSNQKNWQTKRLNELSKINYGYTEKASFRDVGPKILRITDIQDSFVNWETVPYCKCSDDGLLKYELFKGDIVFARTGATTGKSYLLKESRKAVFASYLIRLRVLDDVNLLPEFLYYFFQTAGYWEKIRKGSTGSAQGGFNASKLGNLSISFPPIGTDQVNLVEKYDQIYLDCKKFQTLSTQKLLLLEFLKKSILQKAFAGEL